MESPIFPFLRYLSNPVDPQILPSRIQEIISIYDSLKTKTGFYAQCIIPIIPIDVSVSFSLPFIPSRIEIRQGVVFTNQMPMENAEGPTGAESLERQQQINSTQPIQIRSSSNQLSIVQEIATTATHLLILRTYISSLSEKIQEVLKEKKKYPKSPCQKLKELKKELLDLMRKLDIELLEFGTQSNSCTDNEKVEKEMATRKRKIENLLEALSNQKIMEKLNANHPLGFSDYLADIIGLRRDVVRRIFENQSDFIMDHYGIEKLIHAYFDKADVSRVSFKDQLQSLGFIEGRARYLTSKIGECEWLGHISVKNFARRFVEDLFKYDILLTDKETNFPNATFNQIYELDSFVNDSKKKPIKCMNTHKLHKDESNSKQMIGDIALEELTSQAEDGYENWYHGTDIESSENIRTQGILIEEGSKQNDFSNGNGFYLTNKHNTAFEYAFKPPCPIASVLRYKIPNDFFTSPSQKKGLDLSDDPIKCKDVVRFFRSGNKDDPRKLKNELKNATWIKGPLSRDGLGAKKPPAWDSSIPLQFCIKNESVAEEWNQFLDFILYIKRK